MNHLAIKDLKQFLAEEDARLVKQRHSILEMSFEDILLCIQPGVLAQKYIDFYKAHPRFAIVPAGAKHHHWWRGGLSEHCKEMLGLGLDLMHLYPGDLNRFTESDLIIAVFLHDFAKIWTYRELTAEEKLKHPERYSPQQQFVMQLESFNKLDPENKTAVELMKFGIQVSEIQWSAVLFAAGGYSPANFTFKGISYTSDHVLHANPLAVFLHMLDLYSSQLLGKSLYQEDQPEEISAEAPVSAG